MIVGYFENLVEAQKFVQSKLLAGVVQEIYEEGQLLQMLPVFTIDSKFISYNRETTPPSADFYNIHQQIDWKAQATGDTKEVALKIVAEASILDKFIMDTYKNPNDYRTMILSQLRKGCMRTIEDKLIYGDIDSDPKEFDGIGRLFEHDAAGGETFLSTGDYPQIYDMNDAGLSLAILRRLIDAVRPKPDIFLMTRTQRNTLSAAAFEKGVATTASPSPGGVITMNKNEFGGRVEYFDGIRIVISDYLSDHEVNDTGVKSTGTTEISSIYAIRFGQIMDGGLCLMLGGQTGGVEFFKMDEIPIMEDYIAEGIRLYAFCSLALGSTKGLGRITSAASGYAVVA